jgi:hypothetical protein
MKMSHVLMPLVFLTVLAPVMPLTAQVSPKTPPTSMTISTKPLVDKTVSYSFEVTISKTQDAQGLTQLNVVTTVTRVGDEQIVQFREIIQTIPLDALTFTIAVDGKEFRLEAEYLEPSEDKTAPRRLVPTTYGVMFQGGRVGISVRRIN